MSLLLLAFIACLGCRSACAQNDIVWKAAPVSGWRDADLLDVHGTMDKGLFRPNAVQVHRAAGPSAQPLLPLGPDLLHLAQVRPFGVEERVEIGRPGDALTILCRPGRAPAGLTLQWPEHRLPAGYKGNWALVGSSNAPIGIAIVAEGQDAPVPPAALWTGSSVIFPLSARREDRVLVLTCPDAGASARIDGLAVRPADAAPPIVSRGTWVWQEGDWRDDPPRFARAAADAGWTELAVQVPQVPGPPLARLAQALAEKGVMLRLLDGDPAMAGEEGLARTIPRIIRLRRWCEQHLPPGVQPVLELDIEPYGTSAFAADPAKGWRGWAKAVQALSAAWGRPVAVDLPWWMRMSPGGESALQDARGSIAEVVVMAYRTDPQLILDAVEPWLAVDDVAIRVAIEAGPVASEVTRTYRRAAHGTLRTSDAAVEILDLPRMAQADEAVFELVEEIATAPARISFHDSPSTARETEAALLPSLAAWPSYAGFRIHGWAPRPGG